METPVEKNSTTFRYTVQKGCASFTPFLRTNSASQVVIPEIPREDLRQFNVLLLAPDLAAVSMAAVKVPVQQPLYVVRNVVPERLPSPCQRRSRLIGLGR